METRKIWACLRLRQAANDLATRGAVPVAAAVYIMLPPYAYESRLKAMIEYVERAGSAHGIQIICAKAETSPAINQAIVYVNGMGVLKKEELLRSCMGETGTGYRAFKVDCAGRNIARDAGKRRRIVKTVYPGIFESDSTDGRRTVLCR